MSSIELDANGSHIIQTIQDSVKTEKIDVKPGEYTTRPVELVPRLKLVDTIEVHSLTGLLDYINSGIDKGTRQEPFIRVIDPVTVSFHNDIGEETDRRFSPIIAKADPPTITFDRFIGKEEAMIMLQSRFVDTQERADLLQKLGTVVADEELTQDDDGVGQLVTMQRGVRRSTDTITNPVKLRPFRTFTEIGQPEAPFIVRLRKDDGIEVGLFEADGGAWRNAARLAIKEYLAANLSPHQCPVIA